MVRLVAKLPGDADAIAYFSPVGHVVLVKRRIDMRAQWWLIESLWGLCDQCGDDLTVTIPAGEVERMYHAGRAECPRAGFCEGGFCADGSYTKADAC